MGTTETMNRADYDELEARILADELGGPTAMAGKGQIPASPLGVSIEPPAFLDVDWDAEIEIVLPDLLAVEGGHPLFYDGESHALSGPGGSGKTWVAAYTIAELTRNDPAATAVFIDYEDSREGFRERMKALGVTKSQAARIAYWSVSGSLMPETALGHVWLDWVLTYGPKFVAIDSVGKACLAAGLDDDTREYGIWDTHVIVPLTRLGITTLRIDHTGHAAGLGSGGSAGARARGWSGKDQAVSGASYLFQPVEHWTRENDGAARIKCLKDRRGTHKAGSVVANLAVLVEHEGRKVTMTFTAPNPVTGGSADVAKSLTAPARVLRALTALGIWATKGDVQAWDAEHLPIKLDGEPAGFLNADTCYKAMVRLADDGTIRRSSGTAGAVFATLEVDSDAPDTGTAGMEDFSLTDPF